MSETLDRNLTISIYGLVDPRNDVVFYVGKTFQPLRLRLSQHIETSRRHQKRNAREKYIYNLLQVGYKPRITLLEEVSEEDWKQAELKWAAHYKRQSDCFTNAMYQIGGGGTRSHVVEWTPELDARLGTTADSILAEELGVTRKAISYRREILGVPASFDRTRNTPPPLGRKFEKTPLPDDIIKRLGTAPDYVLAQEVGVGKKVIRLRRIGLEIPSYAEKTGNTGQYRNGNFPARWRKVRPSG